MAKKRGICWISHCKEKRIKGKHGLCRLHFYRIINNSPAIRYCQYQDCKEKTISGTFCAKHSPSYSYYKKFKKYKIWKYNKKITGGGFDPKTTRVIRRLNNTHNRSFNFILYQNDGYYLQIISIYRSSEIWYKLNSYEVDDAWFTFTKNLILWNKLLIFGGVKCDKG